MFILYYDILNQQCTIAPLNLWRCYPYDSLCNFIPNLEIRTLCLHARPHLRGLSPPRSWLRSGQAAANWLICEGYPSGKHWLNHYPSFLVINMGDVFHRFYLQPVGTSQCSQPPAATISSISLQGLVPQIYSWRSNSKLFALANKILVIISG